MHEHQVEIADAAVRRAIDEAIPDARHLRLRRLAGDGTINAVFRLGEDLLVRVPFIDWGADDAVREAAVLPMLHGELPIATPELVHVGAARPDLGVPWAWTVVRWIAGDRLRPGTLVDEARAADVLAETMLSLRRLPAAGAPAAASARDPRDRPDEIARLLHDAGHLIDAHAAASAWAATIAAAHDIDWPSSAPSCVHSDPTPGNVLVRDDTPVALIDWAAAGVGEPTPDLIAAWWCFGSAGRRRFQHVLGAEVSEDAWTVARLLAWRKAAAAIGYYECTNPGFSADARFAIAQLLVA